ncbi:MAG: hypothetical protein AAFX02_09455, partial [Pseudomonadota bacterium]
SPYFARRTYWSIGATLDTIFPETISYNITIPAFGIWGYHMAFNEPGGELEYLPSGLAMMSPAVFEAAQVFACDIDRPAQGVRSNSIFDPTLYEAYTKDLGSSPADNLGDCRAA